MGTLKYLKDKKKLLPIIGILTAQIIVYYGVRLLPLLRERITMETPVDGCIPFLPCFIVFYIAAYVQWGLHVHMMAQEDMTTFLRFIWADLFAKGICLICFIALPTTMERPLVHPDGPFNLFPSIHCMLTWLDMRTALQARKSHIRYAWFSVPFSLLVIASTLFVKQHVLIDTVTGILCAEAGLWLSSRLAARRDL